MQAGLALPSIGVTPGRLQVTPGRVRNPRRFTAAAPARCGQPAGSTAGPAAAAPWLLMLPDLHILRVHILPRRHRQHLGALGLEGQPAGGLFGRADPDVSDDCCSTPVFYLRPRSVKVPCGSLTDRGGLAKRTLRQLPR